MRISKLFEITALKLCFLIGNLIFYKPYETKIKRTRFKNFFKGNNFIEVPLPNNYAQIDKNGFHILKNNQADKNIKNHKQIINICNKIISYKINFLKNEKSYLKTIDMTKINNDTLKKIYKYITQEYFINIANKYLKSKPHLVELKILISPVLNKKEKLSGSQEWHSDYDDERNLKLFIYLDDVSNENGPLQLINKHTSQIIFNKKNYKWGNKNSHCDTLVEKQYDNEIIKLTGSKGDIVFVDTVSCLHRGSRKVQKERKILYATFNTRSSFRNPPFHKFLSLIKFQPNKYTTPLLDLDNEIKFLDENAIN